MTSRLLRERERERERESRLCATCIVNAMMLKRSPGQDFALEGQPPIPTRHRPQGSGSMRQRRTTKKMAKHEMDLDNRGSLQPLRKAGDTPCCQSHAWNIAPGSDSRSNKNERLRRLLVQDCRSMAGHGRPRSMHRRSRSTLHPKKKPQPLPEGGSMR